MRTTFEQFIEDNPTCGKFKENADAKRIFDIINRRDNILKMMEASEFGKPALSACVREVEDFCDSDSNGSIDLNDEFTRKTIGRMVKSILAPYGYRVDRQKDIPQKACSKYFSTAACYASTEDFEKFRMVINDDIMEVRKGNTLFSNFHLEYVIEFCVDDDRHADGVIINGKRYDLHIRYEFRSQGNAHLLFLSEGGVWFGLSFDGHKGDMFVNSNSLIDYVVKMLNADLKSEEDWGWAMKSDTIYNIIQGYQDSKSDKADVSIGREIKIREIYTGGSEFIFCGVTEANHEAEQYSYSDDVFYVEEGDVECFLFYFLTKYFDGDMSINYNRPDENGSRELEWWGENYFTVLQIMNMLNDISACAELLKTDYNYAVQQDFTKRFSIFYMSDDPDFLYHMPQEEAIKKNIGSVIDFYKRFVARMKKLIESDPKITHIKISGP